MESVQQSYFFQAFLVWLDGPFMAQCIQQSNFCQAFFHIWLNGPFIARCIKQSYFSGLSCLAFRLKFFCWKPFRFSSSVGIFCDTSTNVRCFFPQHEEWVHPGEMVHARCTYNTSTHNTSLSIGEQCCCCDLSKQQPEMCSYLKISRIPNTCLGGGGEDCDVFPVHF